MSNIVLTCPMCKGLAEIHATGTVENEYDWQVLWIKCSNCDMELSLKADFWFLKENTQEILVECWSKL